MSEIVIRAERVRKSYKLYDSPRHRLLDMLGLNRRESGFRLHHALSNVTFNVRRGEKVAIIGRNGAGKSTLLKLVTQVILPTGGALEVSGSTRALLSIGSGFHPEFTGRQNIEAYLASLGFKGAELQDLTARAIAFAEIEDYADQPLKTYSTGMGMRVMFAAATMIKPDLLVIDEVLGVGDAYFQHKSFQHISEICAAGETTLLLVTHDIYSASRLCDRMLWLERGQLLIDGTPELVMRAYQDSIREQEERRLRSKALSARAGGSAGAHGQRRVLVDVQSDGNQPPPAPLHIAALSLLVGGVQIATAPMTDLAFGGDGTAYLVTEGSNWGDTDWIEGRLARPLRAYGSPFHKITAAFHVEIDDEDLTRLGVRITAYSAKPGAFTVRVHADGLEESLGSLEIEPSQWCDRTLTIARTPDIAIAPRAEVPAEAAEPAALGHDAAADEPTTAEAKLITPSLNVTDRYGTGDVEVLALRAFDQEGSERHIFPAGGQVTLRLDYRLRRPGLCERLTVVIHFKRDGVTDVARLICEDLLFDEAAHPEGTLVTWLQRLPVGVGKYQLTVMVSKEGYHRERQTLFFTINPGVYDVRDRLLELEIEDTRQIYLGTGAVLDARWELELH